MSLVSDQQDRVTVAGEPPGFEVDLGDQRARRVDDGEPAPSGILVNLRGDSVRRQDEHRALRRVALVLHEHGALGLEVPDHVDVVHDLLPDVDRRPIDAQGSLNRVHGALHSRAVATGPGEEDASRHGFMVPLGSFRPSLTTNSPRADSQVVTGPPGEGSPRMAWRT